MRVTTRQPITMKTPTVHRPRTKKTSVYVLVVGNIQFGEIIDPTDDMRDSALRLDSQLPPHAPPPDRVRRTVNHKPQSLPHCFCPKPAIGRCRSPFQGDILRAPTFHLDLNPSSFSETLQGRGQGILSHRLLSLPSYEPEGCSEKRSRRSPKNWITRRRSKSYRTSH